LAFIIAFSAPRGMLLVMSRELTFRTIRLPRDRAVVVANFRATHFASYGDAKPSDVGRYLPWLRTRIDEFPDGHVLAMLGNQCIGQLELQVPYGLTRGYVNLFFVAEPFRGQGFGRALHDYVERYLKSWDADTIDLHVSSTNSQAVGFYRHLGYRLAHVEGRMWHMTRKLDFAASAR
jgi:ribosomal protein S18 acetylase RimI-like enzyme